MHLGVYINISKPLKTSRVPLSAIIIFCRIMHSKGFYETLHDSMTLQEIQIIQKLFARRGLGDFLLLFLNKLNTAIT